MKVPFWRRVWWFSGDEPPDELLCVFAWFFFAFLSYPVVRLVLTKWGVWLP